MTFLINPYALSAAGGGPGASSVYFTDSDATQYSTTSTSYADKFSTTIPAAQQQASQTYVGFWSVEVSGETPGINLSKDGVSVYSPVISQSPFGTSVIAVSGMFIHSAGTTPADVTYALQLASGVEGNTAYGRNWKISWFKLGPNDIYTTAYSAQTVSSTTASVMANLSFTPPSSGDYLVLGAFAINNSNSIRDSRPQITDGTTATPEFQLYGGNSLGGQHAGILPLVLSGISGSKSVDFKLRIGATTNTSTITNLVLLAIRLDRFANVHNAIMGSDSAGSESTNTAAQSQSFTAAAEAHFTLASWFTLNSSTSSVQMGVITYDDAGVTVGTEQRAPISSTSPRAISGSTHGISDYAAGSHAQTLYRRTIGTSTITVLAGSGLMTLDLGGLT